MNGRGLVVTDNRRYACSGLPTASSAGTYAYNRPRVPSDRHPLLTALLVAVASRIAVSSVLMVWLLLIAVCVSIM
ncbi:hypothetical protein RB195_022471 [Necator americanus]|uniref:Uncharacterized protein n=1 Tax=Necator americanus TaxID=51031 RepID=A0ABR1EHN3_NECAM